MNKIRMKGWMMSAVRMREMGGNRAGAVSNENEGVMMAAFDINSGRARDSLSEKGNSNLSVENNFHW